MTLTVPTAATLREELALHSNAYDDHVAAFEERTGLGWHDPTPPGTGPEDRLSVIVPVRDMAYCLPTVLDALAAQDTAAPPAEVIVVDDGSADGSGDLAREHPLRPVTVRIPGGRGRATARNAGAAVATGTTLVFIDADMALPPHALTDIAARASDRLILLGFRHNVPYRPAPGGRAAHPAWPASLAADHRVTWRAEPGKLLYTGTTLDKPVQASPLHVTDGLRGLGYARTCYDWDLPRMVVTCTVAVPAAAFAGAGGFCSRFDTIGWGCEDTYLGASLIGAGVMIAPLRQLVGYHINPPDEEASWKAKLGTWPETVALYRALLEDPPPHDRDARFRRDAAELLAGCEVTR